MGLDMYALTTTEKPGSAVDFEIGGAASGLHRWRKHPNLHGWMEALYREKGGSADPFNCVCLQLDRADIDRLETDIKAKRLPDTAGFFFGESDGTEIEDDLAFVNEAREALAADLAVCYTSWW